MKPNFVAVAVKNSGVSLEEILPVLVNSPPERKHYLYTCTLFRRIATGELLVGADPRPFHENLFKSSRAFAYFLERAPKSELLTSASEPFFDAVACRDDEGAKKIATLSPASFQSGKEYEEDFWYLRFLMDLYLKRPRAPLAKLLDDWEALAATGEEDLRAPVCRALLDKDQKAFDSALEELIGSIEAKIKKERKEETLNPDVGPTTAKISTEILALLELAEQAGLKVRGERPLAPGLARKFGKNGPKFPAPDAWMTPEPWNDLPPDPPSKAGAP